MLPAKKTFYRRVLPDVCIAFASEKGKKLFKDAMATEYMNCYFPLASQFRTQEEPAYCGLSSLVMVLNALAVDPGVVWKGVFRWYHEDMLDCCSSLEEIRTVGISIENLMCLALCNQLYGEMRRYSEHLSIDYFREEVKNATMSSNKAIIVSYGRAVLGQTGSGHFSPIGGYNLQEDMVLIMDVARFKYPPYWVPLTELWKAMKTKDKATGLYRGYMVLWRADEGNMPSQPPLIFKIARGLNAFKPILRGSGSFLLKMKSFLLEKVKEENDRDILRKILVTYLDQSHQHAESEDARDSPNLLSTRATNKDLKDSFPNHAEALQHLITAINETSLYKSIWDLFPKGVCCRQALFVTENGENVDGHCGRNIFEIKSDDCVICLPHFLTVFLLSFPVDNVTCCKGCSSRKSPQKSTNDINGTYYAFLRKLIDSELNIDDCVTCKKSVKTIGRDLLVNEVSQLRRQFTALMNFEVQSN